jgi:hypothetical protein
MERGGVWLGQGEAKKNKSSDPRRNAYLSEVMGPREPLCSFRRDDTMDQALFGFNTGKYARDREELLKSAMGLRVPRRRNEQRGNGNDYGIGRRP